MEYSDGGRRRALPTVVGFHRVSCATRTHRLTRKQANARSCCIRLLRAQRTALSIEEILESNTSLPDHTLTANIPRKPFAARDCIQSPTKTVTTNCSCAGDFGNRRLWARKRIRYAKSPSTPLQYDTPERHLQDGR